MGRARARVVKFLDEYSLYIERKARKKWTCRGDGAGRDYRKFSANCPGVIEPGAVHVEYVGETAPFQSGTRHCLDCYREFHV